MIIAGAQAPTLGTWEKPTIHNAARAEGQCSADSTTGVLANTPCFAANLKTTATTTPPIASPVRADAAATVWTVFLSYSLTASPPPMLLLLPVSVSVVVKVPAVFNRSLSLHFRVNQLLDLHGVSSFALATAETKPQQSKKAHILSSCLYLHPQQFPRHHRRPRRFPTSCTCRTTLSSHTSSLD